MNICIACNKPYLLLTKTMLRSLAENNKSAKNGITVYCLNSDMRPNEVKEFEAWCVSIGLRLKYIFIDRKVFPENIIFSICKISSIVTYYRLLVPFLIPKNSDMIIKGNIEDLYEVDFNDNLIVAAPDICCYDEYKKVNYRIGLSQNHIYFNAGMLLMNLSAFRKEYSINDVFQCARSIQNSMIYGDQDILNVLCCNKVKYVSLLKYNFQVRWHTRTANCDFLLKYDTRIIHYIDKRKPYYFLYANKLKKLFWKYAKKNRNYGRYVLFCIFNPILTIAWEIYVKIKRLKNDYEIDYQKFKKIN